MTTDPAALSHLRHELRTPLNHIIGYSEMLLEETDDARPVTLVSALRRVHDEARQLLGLVNSVLGPSANETRVDVGRMAEALSPTLHRVVEASQDSPLGASPVPDVIRGTRRSAWGRPALPRGGASARLLPAPDPGEGNG